MDRADSYSLAPLQPNDPESDRLLGRGNPWICTLFLRCFHALAASVAYSPIAPVA